MQRIDEEQLGHDHGRTLEVDGLPTVVVQGFHLEHAWVDIVCDMRQETLEIGKEWGIVQGPF